MTKYLPLLLLALLFNACSNTTHNSESKNAGGSTIDSCAIAQRFANAGILEASVDSNYSGELKNFWGEDTTKLDFKHIFEKGKLVKTYFYFENQLVEEEYSYKCGALHGVQKWYHDNGKLAQSILYTYGYREGPGHVFDRKGRLVREANFVNDSMIGKPQEFDTLGNKVEIDTLNFN